MPPSRTAGAWHAILKRADFRELARRTPLERVQLLREGVPAELISRLAESMAISRERLYRIVGLSRSTGDRKLREGQPLEDDQAERVMGLAQLVGLAQRLVEESGDATDFDAARWVAEWLDEPVPALGGRTPGELMDTGEGRALVSGLLLQQQAGVYV